MHKTQQTLFVAPHGFCVSPLGVFLLDAVRAISAVAVFAGHLRSLFFVDYEHVASKNLFIQILYFLTGFGHQAVVVFFVLSGLCITLSILKQSQDGTWTWWRYLLLRFTRLEIVLLPALALGFFWDNLGMSFFGTVGIYSGDPQWGNVQVGSIASKTSWTIYLSNALFLQNIWTPTAGSNGALWSLNYEFWYYLLFPLLFFFFRSLFYSKAQWPKTQWPKAQWPKAEWFLLVPALAISWFLYRSGMLFSFGLWLMGSIVASLFVHQFKTKTPGPVLWCIALLFVCGTLAASRIPPQKMPLSPVLLEYATAVSIAFLLYLSLNDSRSLNLPRQINVLVKRSAGFSYTLYLVHLPFLVFWCGALTRSGRWQPDTAHLGYAAVLFACGVLYAYIVALATEQHTKKIQTWMIAGVTKSFKLTLIQKGDAFS